MRHFRSVFMAVALAGLAAALPVHAQGFPAERQIESISDDVLTTTLSDLGATWETTERDDGSVIYRVTFSNGLKAFGYFRACEAGECRGLVLLATFGAPSDVSASVLDEKIRTFNDSFPAGKGFRGTDGNPLVQDYVITDNGITMGNLRSQIVVFSDVAMQFSASIGE